MSVEWAAQSLLPMAWAAVAHDPSGLAIRGPSSPKVVSPLRWTGQPWPPVLEQRQERRATAETDSVEHQSAVAEKRETGQDGAADFAARGVDSRLSVLHQVLAAIQGNGAYPRKATKHCVAVCQTADAAGGIHQGRLYLAVECAQTVAERKWRSQVAVQGVSGYRGAVLE